MTDTTGRDEKLEKELLGLWQESGTPSKDVEVWPIPRPTGGVGPCVNFLPADNRQAESMILTAIAHLIRRRISTRFSALQFGVNTQLQGTARVAVSARYFLESDHLRSIEGDLKHLSESDLDSLVTTKLIHPLPKKSGA
jgi:hypothetical protein